MRKDGFTKKAKILLYCTLTVVMVLLCAVGISAAQGPKAQDGEFTVGIIGPLSGTAKVWGQGIVRGVEMAAEEINAKGGVRVAGKNYKIKIKAYDDKYKGSEGATAANNLIFKDNVKFIFGSIATTSILAFQVITEPNKVLCHINGYFKGSLSPEKPFSFRVIQTSHEYTVPLIAALIKQRPQLKTYATIARNDANGNSVTNDFVTATGSKLKLLKSEYFAAGTEDFYPMLTRLKSENPDLIMSCALPPGDIAKILKQARQLGIKSVFLGHSGAVEKPSEFISVAEKENLKDFYYGVDFNPGSADPKVVAFTKRYQEKYGEICYGYVDPCYYDAMNALAYAIEKMNSFDTEKIKDFYETKIGNLPGVMGPLRFTGKEYYGIAHQRVTSCYLATFEDGKQKIIERVQ